MSETDPIKVLFVCMGNICRSPTADGVFCNVVEQAGLAECFYIDSAGTHGYHVGEPPDQRAIDAAARRGYRLEHLRARKVESNDFSRFDYIVAMDEENLSRLKHHGGCKDDRKLSLFLEHGNSEYREVPDPYYGGAAGFELVLDLVEEASNGLLAQLRQRHGL